MNLGCNDIDLVVDIPNGGIKLAMYLCETHATVCKNYVVYETYGTAKFSLLIDDYQVEIECVSPRSEKYERTSRNPICKESDLFTDCLRRDLTINSLLLNIHTNKVIDLCGLGIEDINNHILRTPCDPNITFSDDPLRMLRVIRFSSRYNWKIEQKTWEGITSNCSRIEIISKERIFDELCKILLTNKPSIGLNKIMLSGLMNHIIPELVYTIGMSQNKYHDCNVWEHTLRVVDKVPSRIDLRVAALLHDIGKIVTKTTSIEGETHFYKHEFEGVNIAESILKTLKFPNKIINKVKVLVKEHMRTKLYGNKVNVPDKVLRKLKYDLGDYLEDLLELIHADNCSHAPNSIMISQIPEIKMRLKTLENEPKRVRLPINGHDLIDTFSISPGHLIKVLLDIIKEAVLVNPELSKQEAIVIVDNFIKNNKINE